MWLVVVSCGGLWQVVVSCGELWYARINGVNVNSCHKLLFGATNRGYHNFPDNGDDGNEAVITFIDFVAAFDSTSHRFLDEALGLRQVKSNLQSNLQECDSSRPGFTTGWRGQGPYRPVPSR